MTRLLTVDHRAKKHLMILGIMCKKSEIKAVGRKRGETLRKEKSEKYPSNDLNGHFCHAVFLVEIYLY